MPSTRFARPAFDRAVVLVCDASEPRGWSAWEFDRKATAAAEGKAVELVGDDHGLSDCRRLQPAYVASLGFRPMRDEHLLESLARSGHEDASKTQRRLGEDLLALLGRMKAATTSPALCLTGGLFFNTYFTTLAASRRRLRAGIRAAAPGPKRRRAGSRAAARWLTAFRPCGRDRLTLSRAELHRCRDQADARELQAVVRPACTTSGCSMSSCMRCRAGV